MPEKIKSNAENSVDSPLENKGRAPALTSALKSAGFTVFKPFIYASSGYKSGINSIKSRINSCATGLKDRKKLFLRNKNDPDINTMEADFQLLMFKWGIEDEDQLDHAIRYYKAHFIGALFGLILIILLLFFSVNSSYYAILAIIIFGFAITLSSVANFWRYQVLKNKKFIPFLKWLTRG